MATQKLKKIKFASDDERKRVRLVLRKMKEVIPTPHKWYKGGFAVNNQGMTENALSDKACRFCMLGAMQVANGNESLHYPVAPKVIEVLRNCLPEDRFYSSVPDFNDDSAIRHADVLAVIDRSIRATMK